MCVNVFAGVFSATYQGALLARGAKYLGAGGRRTGPAVGSVSGPMRIRSARKKDNCAAVHRVPLGPYRAQRYHGVIRARYPQVRSMRARRLPSNLSGAAIRRPWPAQIPNYDLGMAKSFCCLIINLLNIYHHVESHFG